ncbi:MAG TPA: Hsp20/alpha crystallin family protein [Anaerolineae bacterium]|nr:Hsp20/alpha crystallin family protein [Anaerolineae bacterium]
MGQSDREDPFDRMRARIDLMYQDLVGPARWVVMQHTHAWRPPTDVFETDEAVIIRIEVAGMRETDFNVVLSDQLLVVTGFRQDPSPKVAYHQMEVRYGEFRVEVFLHWAIGEAGIQAVYDNGFLQVILPKARKRQIPIAEVGS